MIILDTLNHTRTDREKEARRLLNNHMNANPPTEVDSLAHYPNHSNQSDIGDTNNDADEASVVIQVTPQKSPTLSPSRQVSSNNLSEAPSSVGSVQLKRSNNSAKASNPSGLASVQFPIQDRDASRQQQHQEILGREHMLRRSSHRLNQTLIPSRNQKCLFCFTLEPTKFSVY